MAFTRYGKNRNRSVGKEYARRRTYGGYGRKSYSRSRYGGRRTVRKPTVRDVVKNSKEMERGAKQHVTLTTQPEDVGYGVEPAGANDKDLPRYLVVPVTAALPSQYPGNGYPSDALRKSWKVLVKGVKLSFTVMHKHGVRVSGVAHSKSAVPECAVQLEANNILSSFMLGYKEETGTHRMYSLQETGFIADRNGPYEVETKRFGGDMDGVVHYVNQLRTGDGSIFECPIVKGAGGPIGTVEFWTGSKDDVGYHKRNGKTANLTIPTPVGDMAVKTTVNMYFRLNQEVEFEMEEAETVVGNPISIMLMVCSQAGDLEGGKGIMGVQSGTVKDVMMRLYYT